MNKNDHDKNLDPYNPLQDEQRTMGQPESIKSWNLNNQPFGIRIMGYIILLFIFFSLVFVIVNFIEN
ncbi:hypothetical protein [Rummeliibacillus pycnus]|uniref:hypothetical protein n=1 Tax=Rummeliibacillus pycnus TaxID=101070 RepID=UPI003D28F1CD